METQQYEAELLEAIRHVQSWKALERLTRLDFSFVAHYDFLNSLDNVVIERD